MGNWAVEEEPWNGSMEMFVDEVEDFERCAKPVLDEPYSDHEEYRDIMHLDKREFDNT